MAMTDQEMFDAVVAHCVEQGEPAWHNGDCFYRMVDGRKCALGCLIPDEIYIDDMEGSGASDLIEEFDLRGIIPNAALAEDLQDAHDRPAMIDKHGRAWLKCCLRLMVDVATYHKLSYTTAQSALSKLEQSS